LKSLKIEELKSLKIEELKSLKIEELKFLRAAWTSILQFFNLSIFTC